MAEKKIMKQKPGISIELWKAVVGVIIFEAFFVLCTYILARWIG